MRKELHLLALNTIITETGSSRFLPLTPVRTDIESVRSNVIIAPRTKETRFVNLIVIVKHSKYRSPKIVYDTLCGAVQIIFRIRL